jgi:hypothetical protein
MQAADYISTLTGKTVGELFFSAPPLVALEQDEDGKITVTYWDESLKAKKPTADDIAAAVAAPDPVAVPASVSARQFKLQLLAAGLLDKVDAWVATQSKDVQISYEYSGAFVRTEPMMAAGFAAMGVTKDQIDAFFIEAGKI